MPNKPGISVIMPCYNAGAFIEEAVVSVWEHNTKEIPMEIVIVDDASSDTATRDALNRLQGHEDIRVIRLVRNSGNPARPRNVGIACAKYDHIFPLDADDKMNNDPSFLAKHGDFFSSAFDRLSYDPSLALVSVAPIQFSHDPNARIVDFTANPYSEDVMVITSRLTVSSLIRKDDAIRAGGYPTDVNCAEDWLFYLKLLNTRLISGEGTQVEKILDGHLLYRQHAHGNNVNRRARDWPAMYQRAVETAPDLYAKHFPMIPAEMRAATAMRLAGREPQKQIQSGSGFTVRLLQSVFPKPRTS